MEKIILKKSSLSPDCTFSILTDFYTRNIFHSLGEKLDDIELSTFDDLSRFLHIKVGKRIYLIFKNGIFPFNNDPVKDDALLIIPEGDGVIREKSFVESMLNKDLINKALSRGMIQTIRISEEMPRYFIEKGKESSKDIRIIVPMKFVGHYYDIQEFDLRKFQINKPVLFMAFFTKFICFNLGYGNKINKRKLSPSIEKFDVEFKGFYWYILILYYANCSIPMTLLDGPENTLGYFFKSPKFLFSGRDRDIYNLFFKDEFREFQKLYNQIDFIKEDKVFYTKEDSEFLQVSRDVLNFRLVCLKLEPNLNKKYNKIIFEVFNNDFNFKCKLAIGYPEHLLNLPMTDAEKNANIEMLIAEEEKIKLESTPKKKNKKKIKEDTESQIRARLKEQAKNIAQEARNIFLKKEKEKNRLIKAEKKAIKDFANELVSFIVEDAIYEIELEERSSPDSPFLKSFNLMADNLWLF